MPTELKDRINSVTAKAQALRDSYLTLLSEKQAADKQLEQQQLEIGQLQRQVDQLRIDNEYLRVAHTLAPDRQAVDRYKQQISQMVRDIDRCIKQLNA